MRLLECAKIVTTHGIKGEVKIITNDLSRFDEGSVLIINDKDMKEKITINSFRMHQEMGLITFNNIDNINNVLKYVGKTIYCDRDIYEDDCIYYDDLIDCECFDNDLLIGKVTDVMEVPQGCILRVKKLDGKDALIPYVDEFVKEIDIDNKKIIISSIEGLL